MDPDDLTNADLDFFYADPTETRINFILFWPHDVLFAWKDYKGSHKKVVFVSCPAVKRGGGRALMAGLP